MFTSLKKKITEETGTDPTKVVSNVLKGRTSSDFDVESRPKTVGLGAVVNEHDETSASIPLRGSSSNVETGDSINSFCTESVQDQKYRPDNTSSWPANKEVSEEVKKSAESCRVSNNIGWPIEREYKQAQQDNSGIARTLENREVDEEKQIANHDCLRISAETFSEAEVYQKDLFQPQQVYVVKDEEEFERQKNVDNITRQLRRTEEQLFTVRQQLKESNNQCNQLSTALLGEKNANMQLNLEVSRLQNDFQEQSGRLGKMVESLDRELREKDVMLLRNAQLNQDVEMTRQELRLQEVESSELQTKFATLSTTILEKDKELHKKNAENEELCRRVKELLAAEQNENAAFTVEQELRRNISTLEEQLAEKVKSIRVLQQHSNDLKKTLQRELKQSVEEPPGDGTSTVSVTPGETDVNFKYLKHVIMKFLTSREYEAQHLTRAVSTLLQFSPEEERLLRETLDWKMSWFGTRPQLGFGQSSKTIPPS